MNVLSVSGHQRELTRWAVLFALAALIMACNTGPGQPVRPVPDGRPERGPEAFRVVGVRLLPHHTGRPRPCHRWASARSLRRPNLHRGQSPEHHRQPPLLDPHSQAVEPGTAMPNMGMTEQQARDMVAYLYTLTR